MDVVGGARGEPIEEAVEIGHRPRLELDRGECGRRSDHEDGGEAGRHAGRDDRAGDLGGDVVRVPWPLVATARRCVETMAC